VNGDETAAPTAGISWKRGDIEPGPPIIPIPVRGSPVAGGVIKSPVVSRGAFVPSSFLKKLRNENVAMFLSSVVWADTAQQWKPAHGQCQNRYLRILNYQIFVPFMRD
jgi:hypothetical protein